MTIDVASLMSGLGTQSTALQNKLSDPNFNPADARQLMEVQLQMSNFQQIAGLTSAIISDIKQTAQGIIQKI